MEDISNRVPVDSTQISWGGWKVECSSMYMLVNGQSGWHMPWHSHSLYSWAHGHIHLEGPNLEGLHQIAHSLVDCIFVFNDRNFLHGFYWCKDIIARDSHTVHHYRHMWEWNSSWDWIWIASQHYTCSFRVQKSQGISSHTIAEDRLLGFVKLERWGDSGNQFCVQSDCCSHNM